MFNKLLAIAQDWAWRKASPAAPSHPSADPHRLRVRSSHDTAAFCGRGCPSRGRRRRVARRLPRRLRHFATPGANPNAAIEVR